MSSSAARTRSPASGCPTWSSMRAPAQIAPAGFALALSGDVRGGAVDRLEEGGERPLGVEVRRGRDADGAGDGGGDLREEVAEEVGPHDDVEALGVRTSRAARASACIRDASTSGYSSADLAEDLVEERHRYADAVGLRGPHEESSPALRLLEGVADDPLDPAAGEDALLDGDLVRRALVDPPTRVRVLALGVLPDDRDVQVAGLRQRALDAPQQPRRAQVHVLVEAAPDGEEQAPEGDVVGDGGPADGAEIRSRRSRPASPGRPRASCARARGSTRSPRGTP